MDKTEFYSIEYTADGVNAPRLADQLIVYTAEFGPSTRTNEYGYEAVVEDGLIVQLGGNDSPIPTDGFVVSLHGEVMKALRTKISKGMLVSYDPASAKVTFTYNAEGLKRSVLYALEGTQQAIDRAATSFVFADYANAKATLEAIRKEVEEKAALQEESVWAEHSNSWIARCDALCRTLCDSHTVQYRGVWIRPSQKNAAEVEAYIQKLHEQRINFVCLEGWFANGVIMNVPQDSLFGKHPQFDYDVLQAYVEACHKYGMECHLWMPIMNIGDAHSEGYEDNTVPGRKPEWLSLNNHGTPYNDSGFMMIDPSNRDARAYLMAFYEYILKNYAIDCFEMDYIRYFAVSDKADFGYTQAAFDGFEAAYGYGVTPQYDRSAPYWDDWCQYRRDCVKAWVKDLRELIDRVAPNVLLAADVAFPFSHALDAVYQDFPSWLREGVLDLLHPMAYGDGYEDDIRQAVKLAGDRCMVVTGLGAQGDLLCTEQLERQARENTLYGAFGDCFFEADAYFYKHLPPAVKASVYRCEAMTPFLDTDKALRAVLSYMLSRVQEVIRPLGGMSDGEATAVEYAVQCAAQAVQNGQVEAGAYKALCEAINAVSNPNASKVLKEDLYRLAHILCVKHRLSSEQLCCG